MFALQSARHHPGRLRPVNAMMYETSAGTFPASAPPALASLQTAAGIPVLEPIQPDVNMSTCEVSEVPAPVAIESMVPKWKRHAGKTADALTPELDPPLLPEELPPLLPEELPLLEPEELPDDVPPEELLELELLLLDPVGPELEPLELEADPLPDPPDPLEDTPPSRPPLEPEDDPDPELVAGLPDEDEPEGSEGKGGVVEAPPPQAETQVRVAIAKDARTRWRRMFVNESGPMDENRLTRPSKFVS